MHRALLLYGLLVCGLLLTAAEARGDAPASIDPDAALTFEGDIRPILRANCIDCHGGHGDPEAGLDLRLRHLMASGGESGAAIVPGDAAESRLVQLIEAGKMPADERQLTEQEIETIRRWVAIGAPTAREEPAEPSDGLLILPEDREHWAYQPVRRPEVPSAEGDRVRTPIDAFLKAAMAEHRLEFSRDADRATLARRLHLDLTGVPPDPELVDQFVEDGEPGAWDRLVDRVLASPRYGERWGRHWLDVAGYADSEGDEQNDTVRAHAWRYRDYVIRSFNENKPFDTFIREQLAGDELAGPREGDLTEQQIEQLTATGFLRMAADPTGDGSVDPVEARNQVVADTIEIVSSSLLGLTVQCAQCHDHHVDAISQKDYYRMRAVFEPALDVSNWKQPPARQVSLYTQADREEAEAVEAKAQKVLDEKQAKTDQYLEQVLETILEEKELAAELAEQLRDAYHTAKADRSDEQNDLLRQHPRIRDLNAHTLYQYDQEKVDALEKFDERVAEIRSEKPVEHFVRALTETPGQVPTTYLFHRGNPQARGDAVQPRVLEALGGAEAFEIPENDPDRPTTGRRLAFARWLTNGENPLVARVLVNRVWMQYFGRGLVDTPDDFGVEGERPTHPDLLDWLADEFVESGWSMKHLHRLIVSSTVYRQSSRGGGDFRESIDPTNQYYWHMPVRRLEGEAVRDAILAAAGKLTENMYGPPVQIARDEIGQIVVGREVPGVHNSFGSVESLGEDDHRRSVYLQVRRTRPVTFLEVFDAPAMRTNCIRRDVSTDVNQALLMMNNDWVREQSAALAQRAQQEAEGQGLAAEIDRLWRVTVGHSPKDAEMEQTRRFVEQQVQFLIENEDVEAEQAHQQAMTNLSQVLLSRNAFLYID